MRSAEAEEWADLTIFRNKVQLGNLVPELGLSPGSRGRFYLHSL
jgi:hypothetical protein